MITNNFKSFMASLFIAMPLTTQAQIAHFDMVSNNNQVTESVSGKTFDVNAYVGWNESTPPVYNQAGARGQCIRFDGFSNYVKDAEINASALEGKFLTISIWVAPQVFPLMNIDLDREEWTTICGNLDDSKKTGFAFFVSNRGHYTFECWTPGGKVKAPAADIMPVHEWNHLVGVVNCVDHKLELFNNGTRVGFSNIGDSYLPGSNNFLIGKSNTNVWSDVQLINVWCGLFDDIDIYNSIEVGVINDNTPNNPVDFNYNAEHYQSTKLRQLLRPTFHGMPSAGWTNESHGMVYSGGRWHVFFQKNASWMGIAHQQWGHISSEDLCTWREEKIALIPKEWYDLKGCWSGCVFTDPEITGNLPAILYTAVDFGRARICMAKPTDEALNDWYRVGNNPLIDGRPAGLADDFRDPYFFTANGKKYIIVGSNKDGIGCCTLHRYENGGWTNDGTLFFRGTSANTCGVFWEMPNVTPMGNGKYLFTCTPLGTGDGVKTIYWIGTINADGTFKPDQTTPKYVEMSGTSRDGYGLLSPTIYQKDGKTLLLGIVPDKTGCDFNCSLGWAHNYSLPREISLDANGTSILSKPYSGLSALRDETTAFSADGTTLNGSLTTGNVKGRQLELLAEFELTSTNAGNGEMGFKFFKNGNKYAKVYYTANSIRLNLQELDRIGNDGVYNGLYQGPFGTRLRPGQVVKLQVFVDHSIIDIFVNDTYAFSVRVFPNDLDAIDVEAYTTVNTVCKTLKAWNLKTGNSETDGIKDIYSNINPTDVTYNIAGQKVGASYKGIVIRDGRKILN